jgi:thiol-disulfide isomerase/thioredoxin
MSRPSRRAVLGALAGSAVGLAGCLGTGDGGASPDGGSSGDAPGWRTAELTDVTTDETFTVAGLSGPTLVHPFAIWCSTCRSQNQQLDSLQQNGRRNVVLLNIGDDEDSQYVREYGENTGYGAHSRLSIASNEVAASLVDEFGTSAVVPPQSPVILACPDGSAQAFEKVVSHDALADAMDTDCG